MKWFITGSDTNVGKTVVAAALTLATRGCYWKPIEAGESDFDTVMQLTGLPQSHFFNPTYSLKAFLSPNQAAAAEGVTLNLDHCRLPETNLPLFVEGAGGLFSPLNPKARNLELIQKLSLPVLIVARGTLGTINHTLLTVEILQHHNIKIKGIIISGDLHPPNKNDIEHWGNVPILFHLPKFDKLSSQALHYWVNENKLHLKEVFYEFTKN